MSSEKFTYLNGNYVVRWRGLNLQKRCLRLGEDFMPDFPDSIDLKITNKCSWGCPYCHESSTKDGESFDYDKTTKILSQLPELPIEIAIGGGDVLDAPDFKKLVKWLNDRGNKTRATVNIKDVLKRREAFEDSLKNVEAVGISLDSLPKFIKSCWKDQDSLLCTINGKPDLFVQERAYVAHIIAGVFPYKDLERLFNASYSVPVLILGYKQWGRAKDTALPKDLEKFKETLWELIIKMKNESYDRFVCGRTIGFDNLALEQLDIKSLLSEDEWERIYMGQEGGHSMYIDAVKGEYAMTSRSEERVSWDSIGLLDYFKGLRK